MNVTKKNINVDGNAPKSYLKNIIKFETIEKWNCEYLTADKGDISKKFFQLFLKDFKISIWYSIFMLRNFCPDMGISEVI